MDIAEGLFFALFWASATVATKFAIRSVDPFLLSVLRFALVAVILLTYTYVIKRGQVRFPNRSEMGKLLILGILNITVYMTGYLIAIETVSAGLISLVSAANPLILILLSALFLKKKPSMHQWIGIVLCLSGLILAAKPNLENSHATLKGLIALVLGLTSISAGSICFSKFNLSLPKMAVNTWQITLGGLLMAPILLINSKHNYLTADLNFWLSFLWLVIPVSVVAYGLWLNLLHKDPVKAGTWMFLTPVLGYIMAVTILHEHVTVYGVIGALLVITGLMYSRRKVKLA
ncbi:DMT family transporter [Mucilaginibacter sp. Bleaf8]|uniref:DMT family transporter n=1 Tax=Mucilaginibacter sp. Bleaf8 TaxID=2834430 RepID=UPI001BD19E16|nr:DMT family transporter [Mucilaginibacter sp. Bleaf8]MBS7563305.1 DMT family transporter [Mucilaginibacter sp. Bleaf8]